jgi:hypothetical protein
MKGQDLYLFLVCRFSFNFCTHILQALDMRIALFDAEWK